jgi:mRNA interferase HicA
MKRRDLERRLRIAGCYLKREGSEHSLWINPKNGVIEAVPRHSEIKEPLAKKILKNLNAEGMTEHNDAAD